MKDTHTAWLAGVFEGEGCISFTGANSVSLRITSTDRDVLDHIVERFDIGAVGGPVTPTSGNKDQWYWQAGCAEEVQVLLEALSPWLGSRRTARAEEALQRLERVRRSGHCKHGHAMSGSNLYVSPKGQRHCRTCGHVRDRARREVMVKT